MTVTTGGTAAPYGSWASPVGLDMLVDPSLPTERALGLIVGQALYATRVNIAEGGRVQLWRTSLTDGKPADDDTLLTPGRCVRATINEYGGGAWTAALVDGREVVVYSDWPSNDLRVIEDGVDRVLTAGGPLRYGSLALDADRRLVLAVREDHRGPGLPVNAIVAIRLDDGDQWVLAQGADFYASPTLSADGRLAWVQWNLPNMPWDATALLTAPLCDPESARAVVQESDESAVYPTWAPDGSLIYLSDRGGYWNFCRWDDTDCDDPPPVRLHDHPYDFCGPMWVPDPAPYCLIAADRDTVTIGCSWLDDGLARLGVLDHDLRTGATALAPIESPAVEATICGHGQLCAVSLGYADRPGGLALLDWGSSAITPVRPQALAPALAGFVSVAQPLTIQGEYGPFHAWYYPPTNPDFHAPDGELPPVQVWSHGGPTGVSSAAFRIGTQFWTTRGIGILDVNYSGSAGFGRAYRERLKGNWGLADVSDCVSAVRELVDRGLADPARLSIRGGSAGGFTTLAALVFTDVFAAGISLYGVGDLEALATDTHKFESRYLDGLVAPYPAGRQVYLDRSPVHHLDGLSCPMLILQGLDDRVVPPEQAYAMADAVRAKGLPVELITFEGESHGFRKAESIIATAQAALAFLGDVHGFVPAG